MTRELHERAVEIFVQAVEIAGATERRQWVDSICLAEPELHQRVIAMLQADTSTGLSNPAMDLAAELVAEQGTIPSGITHSRLGPYLVGELVGMGGMGAVYAARDTRLDRKVALKVLSSHFGTQLDRLSRFRQEARAASLLNHPNIVSIYDAEFSAGLCYIATEFVEGKTLRQLLPLNLPALIDTSVQICSALEAAHNAGIIHRDIKPENIMVRTDGIVKVLDFGLAKLTEPSTTQPITETATGILTGTGPYVSPEQLLGNPATPQSDLFALGVLLFEAATGGRPFTGPTQVATASAILHHEPAPSTLPADFNALVQRLLQKDPTRRYQTAAEVRTALQQLPRNQPIQLVTTLRRTLISTALIGVACAAVGIAATWFFLNGNSKPQPVRVERVTEVRSEAIYSNLTPDGKQLIYSSADDGKWSIYLQRVGGRTNTNLTGNSQADDTEPALSRDGARIAFRSERDGGGIFVMETTGENPVKLTSTGHLPAWSPDGKSIVWCDATFVVPGSRGSLSHLHVTDVKTGHTRTLTTPDAVQPAWSPRGSRIAFWGYDANGERDITTAAADGTGASVPVTNDAAIDWNPIWSPDGRYLYFISDRDGSMNLWRVPIDEHSGKTTGPLESVVLPAGSIRSLSFSSDGELLAYSTSEGHSELYSVGFDPTRAEVIGQPVPAPAHTHVIASFSISPDGSSIVYDTIGDVTENIWYERLDGTERRRLTSDTTRDRVPEWSPTGNEVLFFSNRSGVFNEYAIRPDGSGQRQLTAFKDHGAQSVAWSPNAQQLLVVRQHGGLSVIDPKTTRPLESAPILPGSSEPEGVLMHGESRNGVYLAHATPNGVEEIVRVLWPPGKVELTGIRGRAPWWLPNSTDRFLFIRDSSIYLYDWPTRHEQKILTVSPHLPYILRLTPDGHRLWFSQQIREGNIWVAHMSRK